MKNILLSHIKDIDGVSPVILLKLCKVDFEYHLFEIDEISPYVKELLNKDLSIYENIYITDLSVSKEVLDLIKNSPYQKKFKIFDHHISNKISEEYDFVSFDIRECGTTLFYTFLQERYPCLQKENVKEYVEHVKNLDLWLWEKKDDAFAKQLGDLFEIYGIETYIQKIHERLLDEKDFILSDFEEELLRLEQDKIERYVNKKEERMLVFSYETYKFGLVFAESYRSEMGNILSSRHPELDFIVMVNASGGVSLRTSRENVDLSLITASLGGGGHRKAAGLPFPLKLRIDIVKELFKGAVFDENS